MEDKDYLLVSVIMALSGYPAAWDIIEEHITKLKLDYIKSGDKEHQLAHISQALEKIKHYKGISRDISGAFRGEDDQVWDEEHRNSRKLFLNRVKNAIRERGNIVPFKKR